jgi:hypothetical protein
VNQISSHAAGSTFRGERGKSLRKSPQAALFGKSAQISSELALNRGPVACIPARRAGRALRTLPWHPKTEDINAASPPDCSAVKRPGGSVRDGRSPEIGAVRVADLELAPLEKALADARGSGAFVALFGGTLAEQASAYHELFLVGLIR